MIVLMKAKNVSDKIQYPFMIKTWNKRKRKSFNLINNIYKNPRDDILLNAEILNVLPLRLERMLSSLLVNIVLEFLANATRQEKEIKGIQIGKNEETLPLFKDRKTFNVKIPRKSTKSY